MQFTNKVRIISTITKVRLSLKHDTVANMPTTSTVKLIAQTSPRRHQGQYT